MTTTILLFLPVSFVAALVCTMVREDKPRRVIVETFRFAGMIIGGILAISVIVHVIGLLFR